MTNQAFQSSMAMLAATFNRTLDPATLKGYEIGLADMGDDDIARATAKALRESKFMPSPAELRDLAGVSTKADAPLAWTVVRAALRKHSYTQSVDFGPLVNAVIRAMGGWQSLDARPTAELDVWGAKEFERLYALYAVKDPAELSGGALRGAFGGVPVRIAIGGVMPPLQIATENQNGMSAHVRQLAESKSTPRKGGTP